VSNDGKVAARTVEVSGTADNFAVIDSGVKPGERVIVEGAQKVRPGIQVAVQESAPPRAQGAPAQQPQPTSGRAPAANQR
jgi:membrane fusion protein, multidrug efflux system